MDCLVTIIDGAVAKVVAPSTPDRAESKGIQGYESPQYGQPETPTEVDNIYF